MKSTNAMTAVIKGALLTLFALTMGACSGKSSNPVKEYPELKDSVDLHNEKSEAQKLVPPYFIQVIHDKDLHFIEGRTSSFDIRVNVDAEVKYDVVIENTDSIPGDLVFLANPAKPNTWTLSWTPPSGYINMNEYWREGVLKAEVVILTQAGNLAEQNILENIDKTRSIPFRVTRVKATPSIEFKGLPEKVAEGKIYDFQIIVSGEGLHKLNQPKVFVERTDEARDISGAQFALYRKVTPPKDRDSNKWVFHYRFDTKTLPVPDQKGNQKQLLAHAFESMRSFHQQVPVLYLKLKK